MSEFKNLKILLTDELHFHVSNFKSLFTFFDEHKPIITNAKTPKDWLSLYGNYYEKSDELRSRVSDLSNLDKNELFSFQYKGVAVFELCKLEFLSFVIAKKTWRKQEITNRSDHVFELAHELENEALLLNMAAVMFWVDWWSNKLREIPNQDYCCIFSGSLIYSKVLIELLKKHTTEPILLESFFTGNEYYFEKKYEHIPNNSDLGFSTYYESIKEPDDLNDYDLERVKAANKIILAKNKNVEQPSDSPDFGFPNGYPVALIIGQVVNDFSVLGTSGPLSTISQYEKIITGILSSTNYNVVFKAHPWESKKIGVGAPVTKIELESTFEGCDRVKIVEDYNLELAFGQSDLIITLCSQAAIEAAFNGFKPVQLGNAFYGRKGFTHDFNSVDHFINELKENRVRGQLTLSEFDLFERFCVKSFLGHLVSVHPSGHIRLKQCLLKYKRVDLATKKLGLPNKGKKEETVDKNKVSNIAMKLEGNSDQLSSGVEIGNSPNELVSFDDRKDKLRKKLRNNPHAYFRDSKHRLIRPLKFLFKSG